MNKIICLGFVLLFSRTGFSQIPWSQWSEPQQLCSSAANDRHPVFARAVAIDYNILLWERGDSSGSQIVMKRFDDPSLEIAVTEYQQNVFAKNPTAQYEGFLFPLGAVLIVWQSDESGNFDLYSAIYQDGELKAYRQITADPGDDINPDIYNNYLAWEREGKVFSAAFSFSDTSWSAEECVDSMDCHHPVRNYLFDRVIYEKVINGQSEIYMNTWSAGQGWGAPQCIFSGGVNLNPVFGTDYGEGLLWQHRGPHGWDIMSYSFWQQDTGSFVFSDSNETFPQGLGIPQSTDDLAEPSYLAFESDRSGDPEVYTHDSDHDYQNAYNLSQNSGPDQRPVFSAVSDMEVQVYQLRSWLAWESCRNNHWEIWGSFIETGIEDIDAGDPANITTAPVLFQNYPNPFNPITTISYELSGYSHVELAIYDLLGRKVRNLNDRFQPAGSYSIQFDAHNLPSGVYIYHLNVPGRQIARKMLLLR